MQTCPGFFSKSLLESPGNLLEICSVKFVDTLFIQINCHRSKLIIADYKEYNGWYIISITAGCLLTNAARCFQLLAASSLPFGSSVYECDFVESVCLCQQL